MATKRAASDTGDTGQPPSKKTAIIPAVSIGKIATSEEMDLKVLLFQNRKLRQHLEAQKDKEEELVKRIEEMEQKKSVDDDTLSAVNRFWVQLDDDCRLLLSRIGESSSEVTSPVDSESQTPEAGDDHKDDEDSNETTGSGGNSSKKSSQKSLQSFLKYLASAEQAEQEEKLSMRVGFTTKLVAQLVTAIENQRLQSNELLNKLNEHTIDDEEMKSITRSQIDRVTSENERLAEKMSHVLDKYHRNKSKCIELEERVKIDDEKIGDLQETIEDLQFDLDKSKQRAEKFERLLAEALQNSGKPLSRKVEPLTQSSQAETATPTVESDSTSTKKSSDEEETKKLLENREQELEAKNREIASLKIALEEATLDFKNLPESRITMSVEYKMLQSKFSVIFNENQQLKCQLEEMRNLLQATKTNHRKHIEQMEADELSCQKKLRNEVIQLEDTLAQVRKEYEMLRNEFEQNMAQNDQTVPINKEITQITKTLMTNNSHLKTELQRHKRKLKDAHGEILKLKQSTLEASQRPPSPPSDPHASSSGNSNSPNVGKLAPADESETVKELRAQLKKYQDSNKDMKLHLDMYKGASKEQRDKVQLMAAERKARAELEELKAANAGKSGEDEHSKKVTKNREALIEEYKKQLSSAKQEEEALLKEMEVTGKAFEDMQEQNNRLIDQLKEKDNANFKLMSERIKANQIQKLLKEEKDVLAEQVLTLQHQVDSQNQVVRKLEDKERQLLTSYQTIEKELQLRTSAADMLKAKAMESSQSAFESSLRIEKLAACCEDTKKALNEKVQEQQNDELNLKRKEEEMDRLRRKLERQKRSNVIANADEVLREEIRMYKSQLTCPCCNVQQIDTLLTKCFHAFCNSCIKKRYETRQRKCPKCSHAFGGNDFHRIYL